MCCIITALMRKGICALAILVTVAELVLTAAYHFPFAWIVDKSEVKAFGGLWAYCYLIKQIDGKDVDLDRKCEAIDDSISGDLGHAFGNYATSRSFVLIAELLLVANIVILYVACACFASRIVAALSVGAAVAQAVLITIVQPLQTTMFSEVEIGGTKYSTDTYFMGYILWVSMVGSWIVAGLSVVVFLFVIYETSD